MSDGEQATDTRAEGAPGDPNTGLQAPEAGQGDAAADGIAGRDGTGGLSRPGADASAEDWDAFYAALGRPETPAGYVFEKPSDLPADFPYDSKVAADFQTVAHRAGLMPEQAQRLHDEWLLLQAGELRDASEEAAARMDAAHRSLVESWGEADSPAFRANVEYADRAIRNSGGAAFRQELRDAGLLGTHDEVLAPGLARMLARVGRALYSEDHHATGSGTVGNPFERGRENVTEQGRLVRNDPARARSLIRAAGREADLAHLIS